MLAATAALELGQLSRRPTTSPTRDLLLHDVHRRSPPIITKCIGAFAYSAAVKRIQCIAIGGDRGAVGGIPGRQSR